MTVKQLINYLKSLPEDMKVCSLEDKAHDKYNYVRLKAERNITVSGGVLFIGARDHD